MKASPHVSWQRTWLGGAVAVGAFGVLVVGFMVMRALGIGPAGSLIGRGRSGRGRNWWSPTSAVRLAIPL